MAEEPSIPSRVPAECPYCGRNVEVEQEWYLGRRQYYVACPRYKAWWMLILGRADRHYMTVLS